MFGLSIKLVILPHRGRRTVSHSGARDTMIGDRAADDGEREQTLAARQGGRE